MSKKVHWLEKSNNPTTRARSGKQETRIAKDLSGRKTINSGATFNQNDIITDYGECEAKTTKFLSYPLKVEDWHKLVRKTSFGKIPFMIVDFEKSNLSLAVVSLDDLKYLIKMANSK